MAVTYETGCINYGSQTSCNHGNYHEVILSNRIENCKNVKQIGKSKTKTT